MDGDVARETLGQAWSALGGEPGALERVQLTGDARGLLPSTLAALPVTTAAVAASTLAASLLDLARGSGPSGPVVVDVEHVALAARSERYAVTDATGEADLFAPLSRFFRTADGWLRLHANYSWHRERALRVLACADRPEAVEQAVLGWPGEALEDALADAGALGYVVRPADDWRAPPAGPGGRRAAPRAAAGTGEATPPSRPDGARRACACWTSPA